MSLMTLENVVRKIESLGESHLQIQHVGIGSPWQVNAQTDRIGNQSAYPCLFITPIESSFGEGFITHSVDLMMFDKQDDKQTINGQLQILSDTNLMLTDIVLGVKSFDMFQMTEQPVRFEAFTERFADGCAGWACRLEIMVPAMLSDCANPTKQ